MRAFITGIAGFVGANLARTLLDGGTEVVGVDLVSESPSLRALGVEVPILIRDVTDWQRVHWAMLAGDGGRAWLPPDTVFHLAGKSHISDCQRDPVGAWEANVRGTWAVLEACRNLPAGQIKAVVVASSNHVFGSLNKASVPTCTAGHRAYPAVRQDAIRTAWLEDDPCGQTDIYGTSKGMVDLLVRAYGAMGLPVVALRHVNSFGPADPHRSHLVTGTICDLLEGKQPIIRGDGTAIKGYLHILDVCHAYRTMAAALQDGRLDPGRALNAGGTPIPVLSLVDTLIQIAGVDTVPNILGEDVSQSGYVEHLRSDQLEALGWQASPFREGLWQTWAWYRARKGMAWLSA